MTGFRPNKLKSVEMDAKKTEDSFSTMTHESHHGTDESSCSNCESTTTFATGFDLNKDINTSETDDLFQPVHENLSSHNVIHVVAKAGIPNALPPSTPLKFKGCGLGWKGSSNTSAFRPTFRQMKIVQETNYSTKKQKGFTGFDLNIAAEDEDNADQIGWRSSTYDIRDFALENCSKRSDGLEIDLNSLYDDADEQIIKCSNQEILFDASLKS